MNRRPLLSRRQLDDVFAWRADGPVSVRRFLAEADALAGQLPPGDWLLNVCNDRYRFAVGFVAGLLAGKTSLQPASQSAETLARIEADHPGCCCLCDGEFAAGGLPRIDFPDLSAVDPAKISKIPDIDADRVVAILFTSGSTGLPQPHRKTWGKLVDNGLAEASRLGVDRQPLHIVGTVPAQHSYGFESTFLLALHGGCPFWSGKPFYPQDIAAALAALPPPRLLVTTPFHLSALLAADIPLPEIALLLSATAPLSNELAAQAEARCQAPLLEIYGSTESGQLASRRTLDGASWQLLAGVELAQEGEYTIAHGGHVEGRVPLGDVIECRDDGRFVLIGRHADLINIAGKRTSLAWLNHQIAGIPGVVDAAFFLPDEDPAGGITRLAAFVVAPTLNRQPLLQALRQRIDPVFLPRPLVFLDALPRNTTGKLPRQTLQALFAERQRDG
ncbi:beta-hydroxyacyl-ACP dehydratase [Azonexus hydrophilus]|uniref:Long-chain-fatty-acid--CoA ligase n=1 Tax=Azonexus hydrophilus TaxID=418702 RepID=A0A1R1IBE0_9RHOO|nr:AMP-binding protein [Azonexus hydrophilus]OMG56093.1 beta-hydroxyacyl-ACP dehydratase [Azonexus hydrophilus]